VLDRSRTTLWLAIVLVVLLCSSLVFLASRTARSWLAEQPEYQLPFESIALDPPPPSWYRGGRTGFLEDVRRRSKMLDPIPLLSLKEAELKRAFERSPWTEEVRTVLYPPLGLTVRLTYRRPVALVEVSDTEKYVVDESAVILPQEDLSGDFETIDKVSRLIKIKGRGLSGPLTPISGLVWKPKAGATDLAPGNALIPAAAKLARFLGDKMRSIDKARDPALEIRDINPMDTEGRGLFLWNVRDTIILWGEAPGEEPPGSLTAEEKWERMREWSRRDQSKSISQDDFWKITPAGLERKVVTEHPSPESARVVTPLRDHATIPARTSGQFPESLSR
jgi:hypothetical protein